MSQNEKANLEVQPKGERRRFSAEYKRRVVAEGVPCKYGEWGALVRREGLTYSQLINWRKAVAEGRLTDQRRGPVANPQRAEVRRLEAANVRLKRQLERAEAIIDAQKKLAALLDSSNEGEHS